MKWVKSNRRREKERKKEERKQERKSMNTMNTGTFDS